jgi:hypothetical protein
MRAGFRIAVLAVTWCGPVWCHGSGRLQGTVRDGSGAVVPATSILCSGEETGYRFETQSDLDGSYVLTVPAGRYHVIVQRAGFRPAVRIGLLVPPDGTLQVDFELKPNRVWEVVTISDVSATGSPFTSTATVLKLDSLGALPRNDSAVTGLLSLAPGVLFTPASRGEAGQFSSLGARPNANTFRVDGVSGNNAVAGAGWPSLLSGGQLPAMTALGTTHNLAMADSILEVSVDAQSETEDAGQAPGANIIIHTRSGTNSFHGSLYGGVRPDALGANDWFANNYSLGHDAPSLKEGGATFGGPLRRDRTFIFAAADRLAVQQGYGWTTTVPSRIARSLSARDLLALLNEFPLPNGPDYPGLGVSELIGKSRQPGSVSAASIRIDHQYWQAGRLFLRFADTPSRSDMGVTQTDLTEYRNQMATLGNTLAAGRWMHDSRVSYSRNDVTSTWSLAGGAESPAPSFYSQYPSLAADFTNVVVGGAGSVSVGQNGRNRENQWEASHASSRDTARHQIRLGIDYVDLRPERSGPASSVTVAFGTPTNQFLGPLAPVWITYSHPEADSTRLQRLAGFAQDTWRVNSRLNVTLALRASWPRSPLIAPAANLYQVNDPLAESVTPIQQSQPLWRGSPIQLAPSVAAAWRVSPLGSTVLRASWRVLHGVESAATDQLNGIPYQQLQTPQGAVSSYSASSLELVQVGYGFSRNLRLPTYQRWNVQIQHQWRSDSVAVSYAGLFGSGELRRQLVFDPPAASGMGALIFATSGGNSQYHGLHAVYRRALASGLQADVQYSWSHSIDLGSSDSSVFFISPLHPPSLDRGNSDFDVRHAFKVAMVYSRPIQQGGGMASRLTSRWTFGVVATARTGFPVNVELSETDDGFAIANFQAGLVSGAPLWVSSRYAFPSAPGERMLNPPSPMDNGGAPRAFGYPVGTIEALGRNAITGFGAWQADVSAERTIWQRDPLHVSLRMDAYNTLNHGLFADPAHYWSNPMFGQPQSSLNLMFGGGSPSSGQSPMFLVGAPRSFEVSLRIGF